LLFLVSENTISGTTHNVGCVYLFCQHVALVDQLEVVDQSEMGMMMEASVEGEEMKDQKMEVLQPWGPTTEYYLADKQTHRHTGRQINRHKYRKLSRHTLAGGCGTSGGCTGLCGGIGC
jgi:hypothetical protein